MQTKRFKQGYFNPKHPEKYVGDVTKIAYRSSWEYKMNVFLDNNPNVLRWSSEPIAIPYIKPTDGKVHRYFPDYWVEFRNKHGVICQEILEVKPKKQTKRSRAKNPQSKLYEDITFAINTAKWSSAQAFCKERGINFRIITEMSMFK